MKTALEILGIPTWHWVAMAENPADLTLWAEAIEAEFDPESRQLYHLAARNSTTSSATGPPVLISLPP
ncbi:hypothetical protein LTR56_026634, partial [Elasticomyces elasticus]